MVKRKITFGRYDTAANGWTLTSWQLSPAEEKTNYIDRPGGDGTWDLSTAMTEGIPRYRDRTLTVKLECSEGDRLSREAKIRNMINQLDGMREDIELPDDPYHHVNGKLHVVREYNDLAHAAVTVTAVCKPWKFANSDTVITVDVSEPQELLLVNGGRRAVVPVLKVTGTRVGILYTKPDQSHVSYEATPGTYMWPELLLTPGNHTLNLSGAGTISFTFREAVLE